MADQKQGIWKLVKDNLEMITACFDEYYFEIPEGVIKPSTGNPETFRRGEQVPIHGDTYDLPFDFNIIDLHFKKVAKIRAGRFFDLLELKDFSYDGYPAVNMMGFEIKLETEADFEEFKKDFSGFKLGERDKLAEFANKWLEIMSYRTIKYK